MAYKDILQHYKVVTKQYLELTEELKDFEKEASEGLFDPDRLSTIKQMLQPVKDTYERWSYMIFLLNKPVKKRKQSRYAEQNKKFLRSIDSNNTAEKIESTNAEILTKIKDV